MGHPLPQRDVPPGSFVRQKDGPTVCLLRVSADGKAADKALLYLLADMVEITGELERQGEPLILLADPWTYRRVGK